ncbi:hypothetical protein FRB95_005016 [Tulasnella sp. JGI-2019a]|nr:hypothetical protein FRB95_005016 [Tulasnella sp. JGI-2019a]
MSAQSLTLQTTEGTGAPSLISDSVRVHLDYDIDDPPPLPEDGNWTRFVCLSDTHSQRFQVPLGDVLLHSGDLTSLGKVRDFIATTEWLRDLPHRTKIIIAGNHDLTLHKEWYAREGYNFHPFGPQNVDTVSELVKGSASKDARIVYLEDEVYEFQAKEGGRRWSVYGCPWTPWFGGWAFNYFSEEAAQFVGIIPKTDILLTHGPPLRVHDLTTRGVVAGCPTILERVSQVQPRLHVFGHIHEGRGATIKTWEQRDAAGGADTDGGAGSHAVTTFVNAANMPMGTDRLLDARGKRRLPGAPGWQPVIVDLRDDA